jgi:hypothetical protein
MMMMMMTGEDGVGQVIEAHWQGDLAPSDRTKW